MNIPFFDQLPPWLTDVFQIFKSVTMFSIGHIPLYKLFTTALLVLAGLLITHAVMRLVKRGIEHTSWDSNLKHVMALVLRVVFYVIVALVAADHLGIPVTSLVAVLSVAGLAISLAIQDTLANVFSGMLLLTAKTFSSGDYVQVSGLEGTVTKVDLMNTYLRTADFKTVRIPNKDVQASPIVNYSSESRRRVEMHVCASYDDDTETVKAALLRAADRADMILKDPAPFAGLFTYQSSSIEYVVQAWAATADYWPAYYTLTENIRTAFKEDGIAMTFDHLNVHMIEGGATK